MNFRITAKFESISPIMDFVTDSGFIRDDNFTFHLDKTTKTSCMTELKKIVTKMYHNGLVNSGEYMNQRNHSRMFGEIKWNGVIINYKRIEK